MASAIRPWLGLAVFIALCFLAAGIGSLWTSPNVNTWYAGLQKPPWTPPGWVFGPVWSILYLSMAVAAWLVWRKEGFSGARLPLSLFGVQLVLNAAWSGLFFALRSPGAALVEILLLWCAILATTVAFWGRSRPAAWLMAPYLAWVTFAVGLNFSIWRLNS